MENNIKHVAFIMDGNRRWAKAHKFASLQGHRVGMKQVRKLVEYGIKKQISYLTFWAFSTENWKRQEDEVSFLMSIFREGLDGRDVQDMVENGVKLQILGDISKFPKDIQESVAGVVARSSGNSQITVNIALNYGGREEILQGVNRLLEERFKIHDLGFKKVSEEEFEKHLYTAGMPDPDIIIRTGGEKRLSGYLPWQSVYSELFFVDTLWPDFGEDDFENVLSEYAARERRFGK